MQRMYALRERAANAERLSAGAYVGSAMGQRIEHRHGGIIHSSRLAAWKLLTAALASFGCFIFTLARRMCIPQLLQDLT